MVDVTLPDGVTPSELTHRVTYDVPPDLPPPFQALLGTLREVPGPGVADDASPPIVIAPPLSGSG